MQSSLVLRRCRAVHISTRHDIVNSNRSLHINPCRKRSSLSSTCCNIATSSRSGHHSNNNNAQYISNSRKRYLSLASNNNINDPHICGYRYLQTSSKSKSPASTSPTSAAATSASSPMPSPLRPNSQTHIDHEFHLYDHDVVNFTNANLKRLIQNELRSMENTSKLQNISPFDNSTSTIDEIDSLLEKEMNNIVDNANHTNTISAIQNRLKKLNQGAANADNSNNININMSSKIKSKTMAQLLQNFDHRSQPSPHDTPLQEIQQWFECASQQESVRKYETIVQNARDREDYASLSVVQRHLLEWYRPLRERILEEQENYFGQKNKKKGANKYGPFLCTLQAEKLAILTTHEATMFSLIKGGDSATLVTMALKISDAIEAEVNVQRLLKKRMDESRESMKGKSEYNLGAASAFDDDDNNVDEGENDDDDNDEMMESSLDSSDGGEQQELKNKQTKFKDQWMYGPTHLQRFIDELNRSDPGRKGKVRIQRANRRAMQLLNSVEPWSTADKVNLGVVLIQMLLETAKVNLGSHDRNYDAPAFIYEKRWVSENNLVGCVTMNEDFYKMVVEDKFSSLDAFTTRHKPMVVPPKNWTSYKDGGYMVLDTEFMRAKGCQVQTVSIVNLF